MNRLFLCTFLLLSSLVLSAQAPVQDHHGKHHTNTSNVVFQSQHGESFTVFIDGDIVNRMPQGRVMVNDVTTATHEVVVILRRPAEKAAVIMLAPGEPNVTVTVDFDARNEYLHLYTPPCNRPESRDGNRNHIKDFPQQHKPSNHQNHNAFNKPEPPFTQENPARIATDDDVAFIESQLKAISFDSDRLALAKTLLATSLFSSEQIARLGQTLDFSNTQVDFLKYAYSYCYDPRNYSRAMEILAFSSDRKKVADYIATQK